MKSTSFLENGSILLCTALFVHLAAAEPAAPSPSTPTAVTPAVSATVAAASSAAESPAAAFERMLAARPATVVPTVPAAPANAAADPLTRAFNQALWSEPRTKGTLTARRNR